MTALLAMSGASIALLIICIAEGLIAVGGTVALVLLVLRKRKRARLAGTQTKYVGATVLSKRAAKTNGADGYFVTFFCGAELNPELAVTQDVYNRVAIGQTGTLLTTNGFFSDFGDNI